MIRSKCPYHWVVTHCLKLMDSLFPSVLSTLELARPTYALPWFLAAWLRFICARKCRVPFCCKTAKLFLSYRWGCLQCPAAFGKSGSGLFLQQWKRLVSRRRLSWLCSCTQDKPRFGQALHRRIFRKALRHWWYHRFSNRWHNFPIFLPCNLAVAACKPW